MLRHLRKNVRLFSTKFSFGASSALITNMGLIMGLNSSANAKPAIITSILVIALADNISDSFGIHVFQESERLSRREVWFSTATNFTTRFIVSLVFVLFMMFLPIGAAICSSIIYGLLLLSLMSYIIGRDEDENPMYAVFEHLAIALAVIMLSEVVGKLIVR
ncbi:MAG TPA: hypothetical protein VMD02_02570 [Candidatus Omnitrophota bacterium]|nr:hypothetical protein [Candidatus Omnitrophota bacterium]